MNWNLLVGILAVGYGLFTLFARQISPEKFSKLGAMKAHWGDRTGTLIHVIAYTIVPILVGLVLLARASK